MIQLNYEQDNAELTYWCNYLLAADWAKEGDILRLQQDLASLRLSYSNWRSYVDTWIDRYVTDVTERIRVVKYVILGVFDEWIFRTYSKNRLWDDQRFYAIEQKIKTMEDNVKKMDIKITSPFTYILSLKSSDVRKYVEELDALWEIWDDTLKRRYKIIPNDSTIDGDEISKIIDDDSPLVIA